MFRITTRSFAVFALVALLASCDSAKPFQPALRETKTSHGVELWADEDCYSLLTCYRGFSSAEAAAFYNAVNGGGGLPGLTDTETIICDMLRAQLNSQHARGDAGIWTDNWLNWDAVTNWSSLDDARSGVHTAHVGNSALWYHEAAHSFFNTTDESVANQWGNLCRRV